MFVVVGRRRKLRPQLLQTFSVVGKRTTKALVEVTAIFGFQLFSIDITGYYFK